jgi:hypothetical protein
LRQKSLLYFPQGQPWISLLLPLIFISWVFDRVVSSMNPRFHNNCMTNTLMAYKRKCKEWVLFQSGAPPSHLEAVWSSEEQQSGIWRHDSWGKANSVSLSLPTSECTHWKGSWVTLGEMEWVSGTKDGALWRTRMDQRQILSLRAVYFYLA